MDKNKLKRFRRRLAKLRQKSSNIRARELISFAGALGRTRSNRGKEPTYVSTPLPHRRPLSIPDHPGSMPRYTAESILDDLETDIAELEATESGTKDPNA
jgi:hypothetical protein